MEQFNEINIPEIEENPNKNRKMAVVIILSCIVVFAVLVTAGVLIVRAYNSDERKLIKGFQNLAKEISERQQLWEEEAGNASANGYEDVKTTMSLNLSGDDLPVTIGMDAVVLSDSEARRRRASSEFSVMNNKLLEWTLYGDDERIMISIPTFWRQNLEFSPERIVRQYNDSLLAEKFGTIDITELTIGLFPEKEDIIWSDSFIYWLKKIIDSSSKKGNDTENSVEKFTIEKLEGPIIISRYKDNKQYECTPYRIVIPKEWLESMKTDDKVTVIIPEMNASAEIMQDLSLLLYMDKNNRIVRISSEEPIQIALKAESIETVAELSGSVYFYGDDRSIDDIIVSVGAELSFNPLDMYEDALFEREDFISDEEKMSFQLEAEISYDEDDTNVITDIDEMTFYLGDTASFKLTGEIVKEPLREEIQPLDGETIQIFNITEAEYDDLQYQFKKKILEWMLIFQLMN